MRSLRTAAVALTATMLAAGLAVPAVAQQAGVNPAVAVTATGVIFGVVTDARGRREADAVVEVRAAALNSRPLEQLSDAHGLFTVTGLQPGTYYVQVGKGTRIATRYQVQVHASERALLLVSLPSLLHQVQFGPPAGVNADQAFLWALRQASIWKPILRLDGNGAGPGGESDEVQGFVALTAGSGSGAFEGPGLTTNFRVDSSLWDGARVAVSGAVGTNVQGGGADTKVAATFHSADPTAPARLMVAVHQIAVPGLPALPSLRLVSLNYANAFNLGNRVRVQYGSMLNMVTMTDTVATVDPYLRATLEISPQSQLEYRAASAVPPLEFNRDYADMPDPAPKVTLNQGRARLEHARHQELRYTDNLGANTTWSAAVYTEHYAGTAINGAYSLDAAAPMVGGTASLNGNLLPDLLNNMFIANGGNYGGAGYRVALEQSLGQGWHAAIGFSEGPVLAPNGAVWSNQLVEALAPARAHAVTLKLSGKLPATHTSIICSYRALSRATATGLDLYDDGPAQSDSYANLYVRQPLPGLMSGGGKIAALMEIHNLLAQGYLPMLGTDGRTLYLMQTARSLRGGISISF